MTIGKASAIAFGFVCATAFGVWLSPHVVHDRNGSVDHPASAVETPALDLAPRAVTPPKEPAPTPRTVKRVAVMPASAASLHRRLEPILNRGANMNVASEGFSSGEQFAAVAHAARNTQIPFMVLKYRVVDERKTLTTAIHESKPGVDAPIEASRAMAEARSDIAALKG